MMSDTEIENLISRIIENKYPEKLRSLKKKLYDYCKNLHFFKHILLNKENINAEKILSDVINKITFKFYNKNEKIWEAGDKISEIYIIFLGEVIIYKSKSNSEIETILEKGQVLGEYIVNNHRKVTNVVDAKTNCILGTINIKEFQKIFNKINHEEFLSFVSFFNDLKLFENGDFIERSQRTVKKLFFSKGQYIFKQDDPYDSFYFIFSGTVRIIIHLKKLFKSKIIDDILRGKNKEKRFVSEMNFEMRGFYKEKVDYNIIDLTNGDFIGAIEYLNHYDKYKYDVQCLTDVEVYKMDTEYFIKVAPFEENLTVFHSKIKNQEKYMHQRIEEIKQTKKNVSKLKNYILSQNKFTKTFLLNHPIEQNNSKEKEDFINSSKSPFKIRTFFYNKKNLNHVFLTPKIKEIFIQNKSYKSINTTKTVKNLFFTNIDKNKKSPYTLINSFSNDNINEKSIFELKTMSNKKRSKKNFTSLTNNKKRRIFLKNNFKNIKILNTSDNDIPRGSKKNVTNFVDKKDRKMSIYCIHKPKLNSAPKLK